MHKFMSNYHNFIQAWKQRRKVCSYWHLSLKMIYISDALCSYLYRISIEFGTIKALVLVRSAPSTSTGPQSYVLETASTKTFFHVSSEEQLSADGGEVFFVVKIVAQAIFRDMSQRSVANFARSVKVSNELLTFAVRARKAWDVNAFSVQCTYAKRHMEMLLVNHLEKKFRWWEGALLYGGKIMGSPRTSESNQPF